MNLAVGDHDRAADAGSRHVSENALQRAKQARLGAVVGGIRLARLNHAHIKLFEACEPFLHARQRPIGFIGARADILTLAAIDNQRHHALQRLAIFIEEDRIDQGGSQRNQGQ